MCPHPPPREKRLTEQSKPLTFKGQGKEAPYQLKSRGHAAERRGTLGNVKEDVKKRATEGVCLQSQLHIVLY